MVPFWVPIIIRGLIWGTQKGTIILTIPHVYPVVHMTSLESCRFACRKTRMHAGELGMSCSELLLVTRMSRVSVSNASDKPQACC